MIVLQRLGRSFYRWPGEKVQVRKLHDRPIKVDCQRTAEDLERVLRELQEERPALRDADAAYFLPTTDPKVISYPEGYGKPGCYELPTIRWDVRFYATRRQNTRS